MGLRLVAYPALVPDRGRAEFDQYRDTYRRAVEDAIAFSSADLDFFTKAKARVLLELADSRVGAAADLDFLDVGCGPGETDRFLEGRVGRLAGVDVAPQMLERARRSNPWAEYRGYAPGEAIPFDSGCFDVCFAVCVLHHVPVRERARPRLGEMARVCRPGGLVALFEHNPLNHLRGARSRAASSTATPSCSAGARQPPCCRDARLTGPRGRYIVFFTRELAATATDRASARLAAARRPVRRLRPTGPEGPASRPSALGDQIERPVLALLVGPGDVEPDRAEHDQLDPRQEGDQHGQRSPSLNRREPNRRA